MIMAVSSSQKHMPGVIAQTIKNPSLETSHHKDSLSRLSDVIHVFHKGKRDQSTDRLD